MDEFNFLETEEKIIEGQQPVNMSKWKKESGDKMKKLDEAYEDICVEFLDRYFQLNG